MNTAIFLAQFWGIVLTVMTIGIFFRRQDIPSLVKLAHNEGMLVFSGFLGVMLGVGHILAFNTWSTDWTIILTLIGWVIFCKGVVRVFIPTQVQRFVTAFHNKRSNTTTLIVIVFILGLYLIIK